MQKEQQKKTCSSFPFCICFLAQWTLSSAVSLRCAPEAAVMIAAEPRGSESHLSRAVKNGVSFSNGVFAELVVVLFIFLIRYSSFLARTKCNQRIFLSNSLSQLLYICFFICFWMKAENRNMERGKRKKRNRSPIKDRIPSFGCTLKTSKIHSFYDETFYFLEKCNFFIEIII